MSKTGKLFCSFRDRLAAMDDASLDRRLGREMADEIRSSWCKSVEWRNAPQGVSFGINDLKQNDIDAFRKFHAEHASNPIPFC